MKWMVAGAGALLILGGAYAMISGGSIIQVERGWATVIAGAAVFGAGAILLGIAALIFRIDRLAAHLAAASAIPHEAYPQSSFGDYAQDTAEYVPAASAGLAGMAAAAPSMREDVPPPPREIAVEPAPIVDQGRHAGESASARDDRPEALRNFTFVFPAEPLAEQPKAPPPAPAAGEAPVNSGASAGEIEPPGGEEPPRAGRFGRLPWLRRNRERGASVPAQPTPDETVAALAEERMSFALRLDEPPPVRETQSQDAPGPDMPGPDTPGPDTQNLGLQAQEAPAPETSGPQTPQARELPARERAPEAEASPAEAPVAPAGAPPTAKAEKTPEAFSSDWLERALAGADEPPSPPPPRFTPPSMRRAAPPAASAPAPEEKPADETPAARPAETASAEASPEAGAGPVEIGRYRANDVAYVMFSDGSITAETPAGAHYKFKSLVELREFIERGGA